MIQQFPIIFKHQGISYNAMKLTARVFPAIMRFNSLFSSPLKLTLTICSPNIVLPPEISNPITLSSQVFLSEGSDL